MADTDTNTSAAVASGKRGPKIADKYYNETMAPDDDGIPPHGFLIAFKNGTKLEGLLENFPSLIQTRLGLHGLVQRLGDSYAGVQGDTAKAYANASTVLELLMRGEWGAKREGGDGGVGALWVEALAELRNWRKEDGSLDMELAKAKVKTMAEKEGGDKTIENTKNCDPIKAKVAEIKFRRAQAAMETAKAEAAAKAASGVADTDTSALDQF